MGTIVGMSFIFWPGNLMINSMEICTHILNIAIFHNDKIYFEFLETDGDPESEY